MQIQSMSNTDVDSSRLPFLKRGLPSATSVADIEAISTQQMHKTFAVDVIPITRSLPKKRRCSFQSDFLSILHVPDVEGRKNDSENAFIIRDVLKSKSFWDDLMIMDNESSL